MQGPGVEDEDSVVFFFFPLLLYLSESCFDLVFSFLTALAVDEVAADD